MIVNHRPLTPPPEPSQRIPAPSSPKTVRIMALNPEPADRTERKENQLPPRSYADAIVGDESHATNGETEGDEGAIIDEDAIKESPPRPRGDSEPRPLGEVIDEAGEPSSPGLTSSPTLRHPKGRLEEKDSRESYADAVKREPSPGVNGSRTNGVNGVKHIDGDKTPETFDGMGEDDAPRSPTVRSSHKRRSCKNLRGSAHNKTSSESTLASSETGGTGLSPSQSGLLADPAEHNQDLQYEISRNKSGENLASLKPGSGYYLSFAQREDKAASSEPRPQTDGRDGRNSELVSGRTAGAGWHRSAIRWAPFNVPVQRRLQTLLVLIHTLSIAGGLAIFFLLCTIPLLWPILLPYLLYVLLSRAAIDGKLSQRSDRLRRSKIWSLFGSYFPARLHRSQPLEPTRKYIFGYHPHGIISHGAFAAFATEALGFSQLFPGITNTLLTLDSNFRIPLYRDYALRMGLASVSRESCENILSRGGPNGEGMGRAITIVVGGARESLDARPYKLRLVLKKRKGFVKLAIRTGADLVPVLAFGENDIYDQLDTESHPFVHKLQMLVKKFMGFTVPLFHARGKSFSRHPSLPPFSALMQYKHPLQSRASH